MGVDLTDLRALPAPALIAPVSYDAIKAARVARLVALMIEVGIPFDVQGMESDPAMVVEGAGAFREMIWLQFVNETALQLLVAYANGTNLDQRGAGVSTPRHALVPAPRPFATNPEDWEADDHYRVRTANALERPSTAGSTAGYREHAKFADPDVYDVAVVRPGPPRVLIYVLGYDGAPSVETLANVQAGLSAEDVRPQNDEPEALAAGIVNVDIVGVYQLYPGADAVTVKRLGDAAIAAYVAEHYALGHDITTDGVKGAALVSGVKKFTLTLNGQVSDLVLDGTQAPRLGTLTTTVSPTRDV